MTTLGTDYESAVGRWALRKTAIKAPWTTDWDRCEPLVNMEDGYSMSSWTDEPSIAEISVTYFKEGREVGRCRVDFKWDWDDKNFGQILREILDD